MSQTNFYRYTLDNAANVAVRLNSNNATAEFGFGAPSAADGPPGKGFRPRQVYLLDLATGRKRAETVSTPAVFDALTAGGQTVTMPELGSASATTWQVTGGRKERTHETPHLIH